MKETIRNKCSRIFGKFFIKRKVKIKLKKNDWLLSYRKKVTSQQGEDGILEKVFEVIGTKNKWCVEFGAWDGKHLSNTYNFIYNKGWMGVLIEGDEKRSHDAKETFKKKGEVILINKFVNFEGENSLDNIFSETNIPKDFDLLSVDIDGNDYHVWDALKMYEPRVVIIEFNPTIDNDIIFIQPRDMEINQSSSALAIVELGKEKGYELVSISGCNAIFVKKEYFKLFGILDNSLVQLREEPLEHKMRLFQLIDGTLLLEGCKKLLWNGKDISHEDIQVLPKEERIFK